MLHPRGDESGSKAPRPGWRIRLSHPDPMGLGAARMAAIGGVGAMLPLLAGLGLASAWLIHLLAKSSDTPRRADDGPAPAPATRSALRVLAEAQYLRHLVALVLLMAIATTFVDQAFKTQVKATFEEGPSLGSFRARASPCLSPVD